MNVWYDRINKLCDEEGISITKLERKLDFGNSTIKKWENAEPQIGKLKKTAEYFGTTVGYLIGETDEKEKPAANSSELTTDEVERELRIRRIPPNLHDKVDDLLEALLLAQEI